jgi:hypothetical protein
MPPLVLSGVSLGALMDSVAKIQEESAKLDLPTGGEYFVSFGIFGLSRRNTVEG